MNTKRWKRLALRSGTFVWSNAGNTTTVKPNGSGNTFGFTTMTNGNSSARPQIVSCTAS